MKLAFVGGTGPAGVGLAARLARAGHDVAVGSRAQDRAEAAAAEVRALVPGARLTAGTNDAVAGDAEVVLLTVPPGAQTATVEGLAARLEGKIVVSIANPIVVQPPVVRFEPPPEGSLAEAAQRAAPGARVVGAFREIHIKHWPKLDRAIASDTLVTGDDAEAKEIVAALARDAGVRALDGGPLAHSRHVEAFVVVLISLNFRYKASTGLRIAGVSDG